jgi:hypothetical protein
MIESAIRNVNLPMALDRPPPATLFSVTCGNNDCPSSQRLIPGKLSCQAGDMGEWLPAATVSIEDAGSGNIMAWFL